MGGSDHEVPREWQGVIGKQISYMILIRVHSSIQLMPYIQLFGVCVCVCVWQIVSVFIEVTNYRNAKKVIQ